MKRLFALLALSLLLFGCTAKEVPKPTPPPVAASPIPTVVAIPSPEPSPVIPYATAQGFTKLGITDVAYKGTSLEFTVNGIGNYNAVYVIGAAIANDKAEFDSVRVDKGASARITAISLPDCGAPGTEFNDVQLTVSFNPFGGFQGTFDVGFISGVCG